MSDPLVTVLMPVYNGAKYLQEALDSVWQQSFPDFELLVIDDGSTDETGAVLAGCHDERLRVLRNPERLKLSGALNRGIETARGKFIARMDADDRMHANRLMHQVAFMEEQPDMLISGTAMQAFGSNHQVMRYPQAPEDVYAHSLFFAPFGHPTVMFRREPLIREGWRYDGQYYPSEDYELWVRLLPQHTGRNLAQVLLDYRVHEASMTGGEWSDMDLRSTQIQAQAIKSLGLDPVEEQLRVHRLSSMGRMPAEVSSFEQTSRWLVRLRQANHDAGIYDNVALQAVLENVWLRMTMGVVREMGLSAWRQYHNQGRQHGLCRLRGEWLVFGGALRKMIRGGHAR